ncbi:MAG: alpha/beta hydrolase [Gemmataceae bacterium]|nr:alpha/beta hydrolase [Gemmataceae bacterium]
MNRLPLWTLVVLVGAVPWGPAQELPPSGGRLEDVIYHRKYGCALTMDVFAPPKDQANGCGVIICVSGGWVSDKRMINPAWTRPFVERGYVVFAVVHGSQPKFTIPEAVEDMHVAVRFIKQHAGRWGVQPDRLGVVGGSAGGHLSLMLGNAFQPAEPQASEPLRRHSSRVAAVACFFPPTDFLNWSREGEVQLGEGALRAFRPPFDFTTRDPKTNKLVVIEDPQQRQAIGKTISPYYYVSKDSAPALIIHGDADTLVPLYQSERIAARYKEVGVPCQLIVRRGAGHGWKDIDKDLRLFADWFDKHLQGR